MHKLTAAAVAKIRPTHARQEVPDAGCPGLRLIIQPSGKRSWAVRYRRPDGKHVKLTLGPCDLTGGPEPVAEPAIGDCLTLAAARRLAADVQRKRAAGRDVVADLKAERQRAPKSESDQDAVTFGQTVRDFIEGHKVKRTSQRPRRWREIARILGLQYPTDGGAPTIVKNGLAERWQDTPLAEITGHDIHDVISDARKDGIPGSTPRNDGASDSRGRKTADALGSLFKWAMRYRRKALTINPCLGVYRPDAPAARDRVLNFRPDVRGADELRWFWHACEVEGPPFEPVLKLLLLTGCRLSEIAMMTRTELSDDFAMLRLPKERTKNNRPHDVPLPPLARDILSKVKLIDGCNLIFSITGRAPLWGFDRLKNSIDATMKAAAGKEIEHWTLHDLRRTAATGMAHIKIPPHIIEATLNHVSGAKRGVAGVYNREEYADEKFAALERWSSFVESIVSGRPANVVALRGGR